MAGSMPRRQWLVRGQGAQPPAPIWAPAIVWAPPWLNLYSVILCPKTPNYLGREWVWGLLQPDFVRWVTPASHDHFNDGSLAYCSMYVIFHWASKTEILRLVKNLQWFVYRRSASSRSRYTPNSLVENAQNPYAYEMSSGENNQYTRPEVYPQVRAPAAGSMNATKLSDNGAEFLS